MGIPTAGGAVPEPSGRTQILVSVVAGLIGMAMAWLLPFAPGQWAGLVVLVVASGYCLWVYFRATTPTFAYVRPLPSGGLGLDGYRYYCIRHRGRRPLFDVRITLLDQCRAGAPRREGFDAHFAFPVIGPALARGDERQIRWKPLSAAREYFLITIESREMALVEELWINGPDFRLTVARMNRGEPALTPLIAIKTHNYVAAEPPCEAPAEESQDRQAPRPERSRDRFLRRVTR